MWKVEIQIWFQKTISQICHEKKVVKNLHEFLKNLIRNLSFFWLDARVIYETLSKHWISLKMLNIFKVVFIKRMIISVIIITHLRHIFHALWDWLSVQNYLNFHGRTSSSVEPLLFSACSLTSLLTSAAKSFVSYILCIDDKHIIVQSLKKHGILFSSFNFFQIFEICVKKS